MSLWKTALNRSIREVRFVLKNGKDHHGTWRFVQSSLPEIRMLNQNTFFSVTELNESFETDSAVHIVYGDHKDSYDMIHTAGLSSKQFEQAFKGKVEYGLSLERDVPKDNRDRHIPVDTVKAHEYVKHYDDEFGK